MLRRLSWFTLLVMTLVVPVAARQEAPNPSTAPRPMPHRLARVRQRLARQLRSPQISPADRAALRAEIQTLRSRVQAIRQSGQPPTAEERQQIREQLRQLRADIYTARHKSTGGA